VQLRIGERREQGIAPKEPRGWFYLELTGEGVPAVPGVRNCAGRLGIADPRHGRNPL
jgi:hypothetical protein